MNKTNLLNRRGFISRAACLTAATGLYMGQTFRARAQNTADLCAFSFNHHCLTD